MVQNSTSLSNGAESGANSQNLFNPSRLTFARNRRGLKKTELAKKIGVTLRSITGYEAGEFPPEPDRLTDIAAVLRFPKDFFYNEENIDILNSEIVSFRAMSKMSATLKNVALGAGTIAIQLNSWIESQFALPKPDLPDFGGDISPEGAAQALRLYWGLGEQPIKNMIHLLEAKGVRVFSLTLDAKEVDAFSMWWDSTPYVLLNTIKSSERSRFDAAHELGHLVLHRHGQPHGPEAEKEADAFASAFLMPAKSIIATGLHFPTLDTLVKVKKNWLVSVSAINYRLHALGLTSEWTNRTLCIQISQAGYRTNEPNEIPRETSQLLEKVFSALKKEGIGKSDIANKLQLSTYELDDLTYGLLKVGAVPDRNFGDSNFASMNSSRPTLKLVK